MTPRSKWKTRREMAMMLRQLDITTELSLCIAQEKGRRQRVLGRSVPSADDNSTRVDVKAMVVQVGTRAWQAETVGHPELDMVTDRIDIEQGAGSMSGSLAWSSPERAWTIA